MTFSLSFLIPPTSCSHNIATHTSPWQVRQNFRPEFVNRIDEYIVFEGLKREQIKKIVRIQAKRVADRLAAKKIKLQLNPSAEDYLVVK